MKILLEVKNLYKSFEGTPVLKDINFRVEEGEFIAIMGQSGSGKSTLLYCISGMDRPTSGNILLYGKDISKLSDKQMSEVRLKQMGFIFQHSYLLKNLSIRDNIVLPGFKANILSREQINQNANILMEKTGFTVWVTMILKWSQGDSFSEQPFAGFINQPDILFGDEPTGALNSGATKEVMNILNEINHQGTTIIIVTHDAKVASRASRVIFLGDGAIHDELNLGKYEEIEEKNLYREKKLTSWLERQDF